MVSVIIPAFNTEKYISQAIESVLNQTYQNFELIVVNDGSTDRTEKVIKKYFNRISYIYQTNKGVAAARNVGISASKGEYIAFLDSDDIWLPEKLELQVDYLSTHLDTDLVYADYATFDNGGGILEENFALSRQLPRPSGYIFQELILKCLFQTNTVMLKRQILEKAGLFDERFLIGEDYDLWLRISAEHKIGYLPKVLAKYRQHPSSITARSLSTDKPWEIKVIEKALKMFPEEKAKMPPLKLQKRLARPYFDIAYVAFHKKKYTVAKHNFRQCLYVWPYNRKAIIYYFLCWAFPQVTSSLLYLLKSTFKKTNTFC